MNTALPRWSSRFRLHSISSSWSSFFLQPRQSCGLGNRSGLIGVPSSLKYPHIISIIYFLIDPKLRVFLLLYLISDTVFTAKSLGIFRNQRGCIYIGTKKIAFCKHRMRFKNLSLQLYLHLNHQLLNHLFPDHWRMHIFRVKNGELVIG